jgi:uncharacterized damage-inducible protein DinB
MNNSQVTEGLRRYTDLLKHLRTKSLEHRYTYNGRKWSVKQMISHIYRWDLYLINTILRAGIHVKAVTFPSHDEYNAQSEAYAATVIFEDLLNQSIHARGQLVQDLVTNDGTLSESITVNGKTNCPNTGARYTLNYLMIEFIEHDTHHSKQIQQYLTLAETK